MTTSTIDRNDIRSRLSDHIRRTATAALQNPDRERTSRMVILGHILDPAANVVDAAITRWERGNRFSTIDRERISDFITRALERSVLGISRSPLDLNEIIAARSPFAWGDRFASACVQSGITEVRRARGREVGTDLHALAETTTLSPVAGVDWSDRVVSAEELFLRQERRGVVAELAESLETWDERGLTRVERDRERAMAARQLLGVPKVAVTDDGHKRWLAAFLKMNGADEALKLSVAAHRDLASGEPTWEQLEVDARLLDLWMDYTAEQASALLSAPESAVRLIASDGAVFLPRPREQKRIAVRRLLKNLTVYRGWPSTVMRLERAWTAEFFDAHHDGVGHLTDFNAEAERARDAEDWPATATAALEFPGQPFGPSVRSIEDVAEWIMRAYRFEPGKPGKRRPVEAA